MQNAAAAAADVMMMMTVMDQIRIKSLDVWSNDKESTL